MDRTYMSDNVHDHGMVVDEVKKRVKCNYCAKEVSGFSRLKHHLGGLRGDVVPCLEVPEDLKIKMKNSLLERKSTTVNREIKQLSHTDAPLNEYSRTNFTSLNYSELESTRSPVTGKRKYTVGESMLKRCTTRKNIRSQTTVHSENAALSEEAGNDSMEHAQKCIGKFLYENGIDLNTVESPSFQKMIKAVTECRSAGIRVPNCDELDGWIFQETKVEILNYVKDVKQSWRNTGCSILLDGWTDEKGRSLLIFIVDCPKGPIYLRSADISASLEDVDALVSLLDGVIEEVGVENVVQVMTYNTSSFMVDVGKLLEEKHRTMFWTVCASRCICLMVERIAAMDPFKEVLSNSKTIVNFIYSHAKLLKLLGMHANGMDLDNPSGIRSVIPFLALETIVAEEDNFKNVFGSSSWKASTWASTHGGKRVADLVEDPSFWNEARVVLKATIPLVRAMSLISGGDDRPQMGFIYETMDQAKETIKIEFKNKKAQYIPFWDVIDDIWNNQLHSPLHAAGYFLNPSLFYSPDFLADAEVASGLLSCIVRMTDKHGTQDLISLQVDDYRDAKGAFGDAAAIAQRTKLPPAKWWSLYGGQCPELQRFAIRILCQTCSGALKYDLKRSLSEELHTNGRNSTDQEHLNDLTLFRLNLRLRHSLSDGKRDDDVVLEEIEPVDDQAVEQHVDHGDDFIAWMRSDQGFGGGEGPSSVQPKDEPL